MNEIRTLDQLIARLQGLRETVGGDCKVKLSSTGGNGLQFVECHLSATGKTDEFRLVSRRGEPCILLSD